MSPQPSLSETNADRDMPPFTDGRQIAVVRLSDWLDWITRHKTDVFVALPMIQRGSVWEAKKIADLWDSLLRGMPIGSLTVLRVETEKKKIIRTFDDDAAKESPLPTGSLLLLDGQQRTLAMCISWPWGKDIDKRDKRVWVDFGQEGIGGQPFRLRVTTQCHPFGFNQYDHSKLSRDERRKARIDFNEKTHDEKLKSVPAYKLPLNHTRPYGAVFSLELSGLIHDWQDAGQDIDVWWETIKGKLSLSEGVSLDEVGSRVRRFGAALERLFKMEIALVRVAPQLVEEDEAEDDGNADPPLIVLFNRIANAGEPLSRSDYVFSLIKHRFPEAHELVQKLHSAANVASLLSANDLVMTAVRLAINTNKRSDGTAFADIPTPSPKEFGRILNAQVSEGSGDFLEMALKPLINPDGPFSLHKTFRVTQQLLAYREEFPSDPGLPVLAFPLLQRQLVQVLAFWIHRRQRTGISEEILQQEFDNSRTQILRFVLFWLLCVDEKEAAGKIAFELLRQSTDALFPGKSLADKICDKNCAVRLQHPDLLCDSAISIATPSSKIRSNHNRFYKTEVDGTVIETQPLYRRWFHRKELLLWLQRKTLSTTFSDANPLAGREDETPYDYEHICPRDDWATDWRSFPHPLKAFCENPRETWVIGNSIGNYCVLESSTNRAYGKKSPALKLKLSEVYSSETQEICEDNVYAINQSEAVGFNKISVDENMQGEWAEARALAFQSIVERRAFRLFKQFFAEGGFSEWIPLPMLTEPPNLTQ